MKFSIVIPNYNEGLRIGDCLESILNQSYTDFDVWVFDNVSTDDSVDIVKKYMAQDGRVNLIVSEHHFNSGAAGIDTLIRNFAMGELAAWVNADDKMKPEYFTTVLPYFDNPKTDIVRIALTAYKDEKPNEYRYLAPLDWTVYWEILLNNKIYPSSPFRRELFIGCGGITDMKARFWDWDFWVRAARKSKRIATCIRPLIIRRIHESYMSKDMYDVAAMYIFNKYGKMVPTAEGWEVTYE